MISGKATLIAHTGYPTETFKSPMIHNPWFEQKDIDAVVVPMGTKAEDYAQSFESICRFVNLRGALITMPHRVTTVELVNEVTPAVRIAGACNAVFKRDDGTLLGDQFDGAGFVCGVLRKRRQLKGAHILLSGAGDVGSVIAASLVAAGVSGLALYDTRAESTEALGRRLLECYPALVVRTGSNDPDGLDVVVNTTPVSIKEDDPLPFGVARITPSCFVGEVVMKSEYAPLLCAALDKGCDVQVGTDMLFEMIPAYLEFFDFDIATAEELWRSAAIAYRPNGASPFELCPVTVAVAIDTAGCD